MVLHERRIYGMLDLLGDLGGVIEIIALGFSFFLSPNSKFAFIVKAIQKLYKAKTKETNLFRVPNKKRVFEHSEDE